MIVIYVKNHKYQLTGGATRRAWGASESFAMFGGPWMSVQNTVAVRRVDFWDISQVGRLKH